MQWRVCEPILYAMSHSLGDLAGLSQDDLERLLQNGVSEGIDLEFKQELPGTSDADKREFLADVTALANSSGGFLLFGVSETNAVASAIPGVVRSNLDQAILRLDNLMRDSVKPRVIGVRMRPIPISDEHAVLAVHIPRSMQSPHMVAYGGLSRFFGRNSRGKYRLDVDELRSAFLASATAEERVERFRAERLLRIQSGDTPVRLDAAEKLVLHVVPLLGRPGTNLLDPNAVTELFPQLKPMWSGSPEYRFNLRGIALHPRLQDDGSTFSYLQVFRDGSFEAVTTGPIRREEDQNYIRSLEVEPLLIKSTRDYLTAQTRLGVEGPRLVMVSFLGIKDYMVLPKTENRHWLSYGLPLPFDDLILPEVQATDDTVDSAELLRPVLDVMWQAAGWDRSQNYNEEGKWIG